MKLIVWTDNGILYCSNIIWGGKYRKCAVKMMAHFLYIWYLFRAYLDNMQSTLYLFNGKIKITDIVGR